MQRLLLESSTTYLLRRGSTITITITSLADFDASIQAGGTQGCYNAAYASCQGTGTSSSYYASTRNPLKIPHRGPSKIEVMANSELRTRHVTKFVQTSEYDKLLTVAFLFHKMTKLCCFQRSSPTINRYQKLLQLITAKRV